MDTLLQFLAVVKHIEHVIHTSVVVSRILSVSRPTKCMHKLMQDSSNLGTVLGKVATAGEASHLEKQLMSINLPSLSQYFL